LKVGKRASLASSNEVRYNGEPNFVAQIFQSSTLTEEIFGFECVILSDEGAKNLLRRAQNVDSSASPQNDISEKVP
jgi:hypothetical protein